MKDAVLVIPFLLFSLVAAAGDDPAKARASIDRAMSQGAVTEYQQLCRPAEKIVREIEAKLLPEWRASWFEKSMDRFERLLEGKSAITAGTLASKPRREKEGIAEFAWTLEGKTDLADYFSAFQKMADVTLTVHEAFPLVKDRSKIASTRAEIESSTSERLRIRFDIRGWTASGLRRHDRGFLEALVTKSKQTWKIQDLKFTSGESLVASRAPAFSDQTEPSGLGKVPVYTRSEAIRRGGYAIAVNDLEGRGHASIFLGARGPATMWKGDGKGGFQEDSSFAPKNLTLVKAAAFADFTNSGRSDLLVTRFTPDKRQADIGLFKNEGSGKLTEQKNFIRNRWPANYSMPMAVADFNNDGLLDFYVGFPGRMDFTVFGGNNLIPEGQAVQGLFINKGELKFDDVTRSAGLDTWTGTRTDLFPHSSLAVDLNQDGLQDILVIDDRGNLGPVYKNLGAGKFAEAGRKIGLGMNALGMGAAVGNVASDGTLDIAMSYVNFAAAGRIAKSCKLSQMEAFGGGGVKLFKGNGKGEFNEITASAGLDWAGEGVAGIEFLDYNNDGFQDLFVANGLWSGTDRDQDLSSYFSMAIALNANENAVNALPEPGKPSFWQTYLSSFRGNLLTGKFDKKGPRPSFAGYQHNRMFRNNGDGTYTEVGFLEGIDSTADGYAAARIDANEDGRMDLVLRNADPGTMDHKFAPVQFFRNDFQSGNSLSVKIAADPFGATVTVETERGKQLQTLLANNGPVQNDRTLIFGLGTANRAEKVEVRFADGTAQTYTKVPKGNFTVTKKPRPVLGLNTSSGATKIHP